MNAVERGMYVKRQLEDLIKIRKMRPTYIKSIDGDGKKEFLLVDKSNPDGSKPEVVLNDLQIEEALSKKLAEISDPENNQIMLTELQNRMSDADLQFMNSVWTQILKGIEKTFATGTNRDLVVDYIVEQVYNLKLNSNKLQKAKINADAPTTEIVRQFNNYVEERMDVIEAFENFNIMLNTRKTKNFTVEYRDSLFGKIPEIKSIRHKSGGKKNGTTHDVLTKQMEQIYNNKTNADYQITALIQQYMINTQTGIAQFKSLLNDAQETVFTDEIAPYLSSSSTSGSGLKCKQLLPRSQKKRTK